MSINKYNFSQIMKLDKYQDVLIKHLGHTKKKGFIVYHGILTKYHLTILLSAVTLYKRFSKKSPSLKKKTILFISNPLNISLYIKIAKSLNIDYKLFDFISNENFDQICSYNENYCKDRIVILDNAHYYRNYNPNTLSLINATNKSVFNLISSNSLFINKIEDIIIPLSIVHRKNLEDMKILFNKGKDNNKIIDEMFYEYISIYKTSDSDIKDKGIVLKQNVVPLEIDNKDLVKYTILEKEYIPKLNEEYNGNINNFLNDYKKAISESTDSDEKIEWILNKVKSTNKKNIIYFNTKSNQFSSLIKKLSENKIQFLSMSKYDIKDKKLNIVYKFNMSHKINTLIIVGYKADHPLKLQKIRNLILFDPILELGNVKSLIDNIILSTVISKININKKTTDKMLDIHHLISIKPKKSGFIYKFRNFFKLTQKIKGVDEWIQEKNNYNKKNIKSLIKRIIPITIEQQD